MDLVAEMRELARTMVERESRGNGDQVNALERVSRKCQVAPRSLRRIITGETKDPGIRVFGRIRVAYLAQLTNQISEMQTELAREIAKDQSRNLRSLNDEIQALANKVRKAKGRT